MKLLLKQQFKRTNKQLFLLVSLAFISSNYCNSQSCIRLVDGGSYIVLDTSFFVNNKRLYNEITKPYVFEQSFLSDSQLVNLTEKLNSFLSKSSGFKIKDYYIQLLYSENNSIILGYLSLKDLNTEIDVCSKFIYSIDGGSVFIKFIYNVISNDFIEIKVNNW